MENLCKKLDLEILNAMLRKEISFIVMSYSSAIQIGFELSRDYQCTLLYYRGYDVLLSDSLEYGKFRIG